MSMWEPRSSHLYVGHGGMCRLWLLCFLCIRGAGTHAAPLRPPWWGGVVCVCLYSVCYFAPLFVCVCARAFVVLCVPNPLVCAPCSKCVSVRAATRGCALGVSSVCVCTRVCSWVFPCASVCWEGHVCLLQGVCVHVYGTAKVSWHSPVLPRAHLQEHREAQYSSFPHQQPKLLFPEPRCRLPTRDVPGEGLSWPSVAGHREGGGLLRPVTFSVANVSEGHLSPRKAGLVPGIFFPLTHCPRPIRTSTLASKLALVPASPAPSFVQLGQRYSEKKPGSKELVMQRHPQCKEGSSAAVRGHCLYLRRCPQAITQEEGGHPLAGIGQAGVLTAPSKLGMLPKSFRAAVRLLGLVLHQPEGAEIQFQPHFQPLPAPEGCWRAEDEAGAQPVALGMAFPSPWDSQIKSRWMLHRGRG